MQVGTWTSRKIVVAGPSARQTESEARVLTPDDVSGLSTAVSIALLVVILTVSVFVPPILLINIPLLILRAALLQNKRDRRHRVAVDAFACPECGVANPPAEHKGELPLDTPCTGCGAVLSVRQRPRVNLVDPRSDAADGPAAAGDRDASDRGIS